MSKLTQEIMTVTPTENLMTMGLYQYFSLSVVNLAHFDQVCETLNSLGFLA